MTYKWTAVALASAFLVSAQASADTIYSNLGQPGNTYNTSFSGSSVGGQFNPLAMGFTASETADLTQIDLAVRAVAAINLFTVTLDLDNNGSLGTQLGSWTLQNVSTNPASPAAECSAGGEGAGLSRFNLSKRAVS